MLTAFSVFPVLVPWAVWSLEPQGWRRTAIALLGVLGTIVGGVFLARLLLYGGHATSGGEYIHYTVGGGSVIGLTFAYVAATCLPMLLSGERALVAYGCANALAVALLSYLTAAGFASIWCFWAAITSFLIAMYLRRSVSPVVSDAVAAR